ncbi:MAG: tRNA lysidine(34) synthetase TilS [Eubacterium sp.]
MENKVIQYINDNGLLTAGDRILIGVSGGADSLALLHFLEAHKDFFNIKIAAAHLHHGLRGADADADSDFVKSYCAVHKIRFFSKTVKVKELADKKDLTVEEAGREARYTFFKELQSYGAYNKIALGHHLNDQAETVLMRLIRGTGVKGAAGIYPKSGDFSEVIRPFLNISKNMIIDYCHKNGLQYRTDMTNFEDNMTRNKIRLKIMPMMREINPKVEEHLFEFGQIASEYETFLKVYLEKIIPIVICLKSDRVTFNLKEWFKESSLIQKELLRQGIFLIKRSLKEIEYNHISHVYQLLLSGNTIWEYHLPHNLVAVRRYDLFWIENHLSMEHSENCFFNTYEIIANKNYYFSKEKIMLKTKIMPIEAVKNIKESKNHSEKFFDYGRIRGKIYLRPRQTGDFIKLVGMNGTKKIKNYFIDRKIDRDLRDSIPLLAIGQEVIWILGYAINRHYRVDTSTELVLMIEYKKLGECIGA